MNKMNKEMAKTQNEIERKMKLIIKEDEADSVNNNDLSHSGSLKPKVPAMTISKSCDDRPKTKGPKEETKQKEEDDSFYFPMSSGRSRPRSSSEATSPSSILKRVESAPIITNDDKGTDYWISYVQTHILSTNPALKNAPCFDVTKRNEIKYECNLPRFLMFIILRAI